MLDLLTLVGLLSSLFCLIDFEVSPILLKLLLLVSELLESSTVLAVNRVDPSSLPVGMSFKLTKLPLVRTLCLYGFVLVSV